MVMSLTTHELAHYSKIFALDEYVPTVDIDGVTFYRYNFNDMGIGNAMAWCMTCLGEKTKISKTSIWFYAYGSFYFRSEEYKLMFVLACT